MFASFTLRKLVFTCASKTVKNGSTFVFTLQNHVYSVSMVDEKSQRKRSVRYLINEEHA